MFLPPDNLAYPVMISIEGTSGSGFYLNTSDALYLVTARHVLFKNGLELFDASAKLSGLSSDLINQAMLEIDCKALLASGDLRKHERSDVAICRLGELQKAPSTQQLQIKFVPGVSRGNNALPGGFIGVSEKSTALFKDVGISNEVFLFACPTSLGKEAQIDRKRPLLRKGIVAGKTEDRRTVIDCPVYFGNSGGLVVEVDEPNLGDYTFNAIGVAVEMVPFVEELWSKQFLTQTGIRYENSGYALVEPIDRVFELIAEQKDKKIVVAT